MDMKRLSLAMTINLICLALCGFFVLGLMWMWRGQLLHAAPEPFVLETSEEETLEESEEDRLMPVSFELSEQERDLVSSTLDDKSVASDESLPKSIHLDVPFTSQAPEKNWDQPWQDACEEAAALMLDAYYKEYRLSPLFAKDELLKMVAWEEEQGWGGSIHIERIQRLIKHQFNMDSRIIEDPTIEQIKGYLALGHPVYVVADGKALPNPHFTNGGPEYHAVIIRGYTEDSFITNDPGTQFGENFIYEYNDLMNAIRDWNNGDVKNGRRVVLVLDIS